MISIKNLVFNPFAENTYFLHDETGETVIIDPGCYGKEEEDELVQFIEANKFKPVALLNTHCHVDHVLGNAFVKEVFELSLQIPELEKATYDAVPSYAASYGFPAYTFAEADVYIKPGNKIVFGHSEIEALFVPGHTAGHVAFVNQQEKICIGGDVLFDNSIGRTDLPGGDYNTLINSIQKVLFTLPPDTVVYPGHGLPTTIGQEMKYNPYCAVK